MENAIKRRLLGVPKETSEGIRKEFGKVTRRRRQEKKEGIPTHLCAGNLRLNHGEFAYKRKKKTKTHTHTL